MSAFLLLHGLGGTAWGSFGKLIELLARRGERVIAPDLPGHGGSAAPADWSIPAIAEGLLKRIDGPFQPWIIGHSAGGLIALFLARPLRARGIVLIDAPLYLPDRVREAMPELRRELAGQDYAKALRRFIDGNFFTLATSALVRRQVVEMMSELPRDNFLGFWDAIQEFDPTEALRGLGVPALLLRTVAPIEVARLEALALPRWEVRTPPGGLGHFPQLEDPEGVLAEIDTFIARVDAAAGQTEAEITDTTGLSLNLSSRNSPRQERKTPSEGRSS